MHYTYAACCDLLSFALFVRFAYLTFIWLSSAYFTRHAHLSPAQEDLFRALASFVEKQLVVNSHEKRGVAFFLTLELVKSCPLHLLPVCLSKRVVRSIFGARTNKKHTLHQIAENTLRGLVRSAGSDSKVKLAIASILVGHCGANFDSQSRTTTVSSLLDGLHDGDILVYAQLLAQVLGDSLVAYHAAANDDAAAGTDNEADSEGREDAEESDGEDRRLQALSEMHGAIEGLVSLTKNAKLAGRFTVSIATAAVLMRVVYFSNSKHKALASLLKSDLGKNTKKSGKSRKVDPVELYKKIFGPSFPLSDTLEYVFTCIGAAEGSFSEVAAIDGSFPAEVVSLAATKLFSLLSDTGSKTSAQFNTNSSNTKKDAAVTDASNTTLASDPVLSVLTELFNTIVQQGYSLRAASDPNEDAAEVDETLTALRTTHAKLEKKISAYSTAVNNKDAQRALKLCESLQVFLGYAAFFSLAAVTDISMEVSY